MPHMLYFKNSLVHAKVLPSLTLMRFLNLYRRADSSHSAVVVNFVALSDIISLRIVSFKLLNHLPPYTELLHRRLLTRCGNFPICHHERTMYPQHYIPLFCYCCLYCVGSFLEVFTAPSCDRLRKKMQKALYIAHICKVTTFCRVLKIGECDKPGLAWRRSLRAKAAHPRIGPSGQKVLLRPNRAI